jgi:nucleotide-binding universal stress UspA family protein
MSTRPPQKRSLAKTPQSFSAKAIGKILVPTDFSEASIPALIYARDLATAVGAKITLLHVFQPIVNPDMSAYALLIPDAQLKKEMRERLSKFAANHELRADVLGGVSVREGLPFDEIAKAAAEEKADAIVISTHGYTGMKRVLLGSTTERVVRHARCPVIVVPASAQG